MTKKEKRFVDGKVSSGRVYPEFFPISKKDDVVNLGSGDGPQAIVYAGQYNNMIGVDVSQKKLDRSDKILRSLGEEKYTTLQANVEDVPLSSNSYDRVIAIDIIEHVQCPEAMCREAWRMLRDGGELLVTFPAMHDWYTDFAYFVGRHVIGYKKQRRAGEWDPDAHNQNLSVYGWISLVEEMGFTFVKSRASTMFPPFHLMGVPRFWFQSEVIHKLDDVFCTTSVVKHFGQALICVFRKLPT